MQLSGLWTLFLSFVSFNNQLSEVLAEPWPCAVVNMSWRCWEQRINGEEVAKSGVGKRREGEIWGEERGEMQFAKSNEQM